MTSKEIAKELVDSYLLSYGVNTKWEAKNYSLKVLHIMALTNNMTYKEYYEILKEIEAEFSTEDDDIHTALLFCQRMYETPTSRAYKGMASMLDRLARYMETTQITAGRDGNINSLVAAAKNFDQIRASFKGVYKDLQDEQSSKVRGGIGLSYDS